MKKLNLNIQMFASTNKTANYDLPQFVGTDKPTWLGDFNEAMADIDAGMHKNATDISTMATDVANAVAVSSQASQDVSSLTSTVNTLSNNVTTIGTTANNAQQTATSALNTANTANGKADTNAGAISSIQSNISDIESAISNNFDYSTTEQVVGKWINGKPLYRQYFDLGALPNNTTKTVNTGLTGITIRKAEAYWHDYNGDGLGNLPYVDNNNAAAQVRVVYHADKILLIDSVNLSHWNGYCFVYYTKDND